MKIPIVIDVTADMLSLSIVNGTPPIDLTAVTDVALTMLGLGLVAALFAGVLYFLLQGRLGKTMALRVTDGAKPLDGIPFYLKRGRLTQETSYLETLASCTLTAKKITLDNEDKPVQTEIKYVGAKTVSQSASSDRTLAELCMAVAAAQQAQGAEQENLLPALQEKFEQLPAYDGQLPSHPLPLAGNVLTESAFVDYENRLYINQHQPLIGTSDIDLTLAADGTLSKATAKADDKTFASLLGYLPTDMLATKKPAAPPADMAKSEAVQSGIGEPSQKFVYEFALTVTQQYVRHTRLREIDSPSDRALKPPIPLADPNSWYRREILSDLNPVSEKPVEAPADKK